MTTKMMEFAGQRYSVFSNGKRYGADKIEYVTILDGNGRGQKTNATWSHNDGGYWVRRPGSVAFGDAIALALGFIIPAPTPAQYQEAEAALQQWLATVEDDPDAEQIAAEHREEDEETAHLR